MRVISITIDNHAGNNYHRKQFDISIDTKTKTIFTWMIFVVIVFVFHAANLG